MIVDIRKWKHVFKLDPDRPISDEALDRLCLSGTDAIMVGGSTGVTFDNTVDLLSRIRQYEVPCVLEISDQEAIVPGFDLFLIPIVLNSDDARWIVGQHHEALKEYGAMLNWDEIIAEGYIILNREATAAKLTSARTDLDIKDVTAYARMADKLFHMSIVYLEYSGVFGDMEVVRRTRQVLENARLLYGGGIDSLDKAQQAADVADTIVVGNIIYSDLEQALQTVNVNLDRTGR
ncbi:heptaprenylglyceryl phosphate synthase [Paenibacillus marchantiophytorum]|uniref:Heptaprenylglyceryl phosphate synthase n=1 Tax=Paenibacillus marchantiophytorum TaxID=1619310 RepID=A0ABQ1F383_9BACL|nr:heptaprenylglyceryl phosphate synthase [Paenibacillus marchantiophytorum]GFZ97996.1 heptaprenylglyceryl phosphate synthase [Paenibacillus marchantiophytorum]